MITQKFLFIFLSLYTIQSYGMKQENNSRTIKPEAHVQKHTKNRPTRKTYMTTLALYGQSFNKNILHGQEFKKDIYLKEKISLQTSLEGDVKALEECYSAGETWSSEDWKACHDGKELIELLKKETQ